MGIASSKEEEEERRQEKRLRAELEERKRWDQLEKELDLDIELDLGTYGGGSSNRWERPRRVTPPRITEHFAARGSGHDEAPGSILPPAADASPAAGLSVGAPGSTGAASMKDLGRADEVRARAGESEDEVLVPMVFRWEGGGHDVYITGTFNKWREKVLMHRSGNDFTYVHGLKKGKHAYKFIVDDEWRFAPDQPTIADQQGNINNFIDLTHFERQIRLDETNDLESLAQNYKIDVSRDDIFSQHIPDLDGYTKEPPPLPPHLRHILLNHEDPLEASDMPDPQHVTLNHLYCSAMRENVMVLGVTERFRQKFVTTVHYSPTPFWTPADSPGSNDLDEGRSDGGAKRTKFVDGSDNKMMKTDDGGDAEMVDAEGMQD